MDLPLSRTISSVLTETGVTLKVNTVARTFDRHAETVLLQTDHGQIQAHLAVVCVGFRPNTELLVGQVKILTHGSITVLHYMQTSDPDIFAAGDAVADTFNPTGKDAYAPLATLAVRQD